jgi:hypothetical protein
MLGQFISVACIELFRFVIDNLRRGKLGKLSS